jgi:hypothetical protein
MLPLELQALRLTTVTASSLLLLLLISAETGPKLDVNTRWRREAEALRHFHEIELVHVENGAQGVRGVRLEVGAVAVFGGLGE